uniref:DUF1618 domain-containing protein n=1 Tax=Oryza punctata TaxID=4537 RepID=A0A0E0K9E6_ORYPU
MTDPNPNSQNPPTAIRVLIPKSAHRRLRATAARPPAAVCARRPCEPAGMSKVISLGGGLLGWVDLWHSILLFNAHEEHPKVRYIPLPAPAPLNKKKLHLSNRSEGSPILFRDVTCNKNGVIKFVEIECRVKRISATPEEPKRPNDDPWVKDVWTDSDLLCTHTDNLPKKKRYSLMYDGWRAMTCNRTISSNCWFKGHVVDVDNIMVNSSANDLLTSMLRSKGLGMLTFKDLCTVFPTLSMDDDIVYFKCTVKYKDRDGWVAAINLGKNEVDILKPYSSASLMPFVQMFRTCTICNYLNLQLLSAEDEARQHRYERQNNDLYSFVPNLLGYGTPPYYGDYQQK